MDRHFKYMNRSTIQIKAFVNDLKKKKKMFWSFFNKYIANASFHTQNLV